MIITANRASAILYTFLRNKSFERPFLLPANVCPVVPLTFLKAKTDFEFIDIDETHAMSKRQAKEKIISGGYSGIVFVHAYGKLFNNTSFYQELKEISPEICIIDDRCLCQPDLTGVQPLYTDLVLYSTGYAKYVELLFGGYGISKSNNINFYDNAFSKDAETIQQERLRKCLRDEEVYDLPSDYPWMDCSALPMPQKQYFELISSKINAIREKKEYINKIYRTHLPKEIQWGPEYEGWRFNISIEKRDKILDAIFQNDLFAGANYPSTSYMFKKQHAPYAEEEAQHVLNLFNNHKASEEFALKICDIINYHL